MKASFSPSRVARLTAMVAALLPVAGPAAAQFDPPNQHLKIVNRSPEPVIVRVLHSDGSLQKQQTVKAGDTYRFTFEWCFSCCGHKKERKFEIRTGSTLRASGELTMTTYDCVSKNEMTLRDDVMNDEWRFAQSYENGHRTAVVTVTVTSS